MYTLYEDSFYKQAFFHFVFIIIVIVLELSIVHMISRKLDKGYGFVKFCGSRLNTIYIIQWLIIGWISAFNEVLMFKPDMKMSVLAGVIICLISIMLTKILPPVNLTDDWRKIRDSIK